MRLNTSVPVRVAILGDQVPGYRKHMEIEPALHSAAASLGILLQARWLPSAQLATCIQSVTRRFEAAVVAPQSSEYCENPGAILWAIRWLRESGTPCLALCGGAQYAIRDMSATVRNGPVTDVLTGGSCMLPSRGGTPRFSGLLPVCPEPGTLSERLLGRLNHEQPFACNHTLEPAWVGPLINAGAVIGARTPGMGVSVLEWRGHPFYIAALFLPHWHPRQPHPFFTGLLSRAASF